MDIFYLFHLLLSPFLILTFLNFSFPSLMDIFFTLIDKSCFGTLFDHEDMKEIIRHFPHCHVEAPGQQEGEKTLPAASVHWLACIDLDFIWLAFDYFSKGWNKCWQLCGDLSGIPTLPWISCLRPWPQSSNTLGETDTEKPQSDNIKILPGLTFVCDSFWSFALCSAGCAAWSVWESEQVLTSWLN